MAETEQKLTAVQFEALYQSFRATLGRELTSGDYLNLFEKSNISDFIQGINETQVKYLRGNANRPDSAHASSGNDDIKNTLEDFPIGDCIITEIDGEGNFNGF